MPNAVIAIIKGGLGNQLFIYAAARAFALRTGRGLYLDWKRGFQTDGYGRAYRLDRFPIRADEMPEEWRIAPSLKHFRHKALRTLNKALPLHWRGYVAENRSADIGQLTGLNSVRSRLTLNGYWQNEGYFADFSGAIREELAIPAPSDLENLNCARRISAKESVSIHIRRVRYSPRLQAGYYQDAINQVLDTIENPQFIVFGDDPDWAMRELDFQGCGMEMITHNPGDEIADLWLMSLCHHAIVANSSFSWWGAWLAKPSPTRQVFFPALAGWPLRSACGWRTIPNTLDTRES